jgi:hypothetical protein
MKNLVGRRSLELLGMLAVGEGAIATLAPARHVQLWRRGPRRWEAAMGWFSDRPMLTRALAVGEIALGLWLMQRQLDR